MDEWCLYAAAERTCTSFASKIALTFNTQEDANGVINNFWHEVSQNAMDLAVLDWCHLYGQRKDVLHWSKVFPDDTTFKDRMLASVGATDPEWTQYLNDMKRYRDKDIAHLEIQRITMRPAMAIAIDSTAFYFSEVQEARRRANMAHRQMPSFHDILDAKLTKFDDQAEMAFAGTKTQRKSFFAG